MQQNANGHDISTLAEVLRVRASRHPGRIALLDRDTGNLRRSTYADLRALVGAFRRRLVRQDIGRGDRVAILMPNGRAWFVAYYALLEHGAVAVPLEYGYLADGREHLRFALRHCDASHVIAQEQDVADIGDLTGPVAAEPLAFAAPESGREPLKPAAVDPEDTAQILYTSGTTGRRKGVVLSHRNIVANAVACQQRFRVFSTDCVPALLPHHHAYPLTTTVVLPLFAGARTAAGDIRNRSAGDFLREIRPTVLAGVPRVFETLLSKVERTARRQGRLQKMLKAEDISGRVKDWTGLNIGAVLFRQLHRRLFGGNQLRFCVSGGARLPPALALRYFRLGIPLIQGWGMTELSPVGTVQEFSTLRFYLTRHYERKAGSIGTPLRRTRVRLADVPEQDIRVRRDGKGEMIVSGPQVMEGYLDDPEGTARRQHPAGIRTGDIARRDADGDYYVVGRAKHVIVLPSGKKVFPEEDLEDKLSTIDLIDEFVVREITDGDGDEQIGIVIKPDEEQIVRKGVSSFGELHRSIKTAIDGALEDKPDYMRRYDFCLTEFDEGSFAELIKSSKKRPSPLKNAFRSETARSMRQDDDRPLNVSTN